ncbi:MAG: ABC transporter permease [Candidatus Thermoplasmatota archaeon]
MLQSELEAIYMMWLRQLKRFLRSKSRVLSAVIRPLFFLVILGSGLRATMSGNILEGDYLTFLAPGIVGMAILFSSMFTGISVIWDKQFGFLQEVLVAPISRFSIIIGRTLGGATIALIQGLLILFIALLLQININSNIFQLILALVIMVLVAFATVGFGLVLSTRIQDFQGFQIIMTLVIMPLLFSSSAFFPIANNPSLPDIVVQLSYFNPLFYMIDGIRGSLTGVNYVLDPIYNFLVVLGLCIFMMALGGYLFNRSEM